MSPNYSERPPTDEELQRLAHLSDICFKGFGIRLLSASGPPGTFAVGEDGDEVQLANFAPLITRGSHHRSLEQFEDSVDILCIHSIQGKGAILLHSVRLHELTAKAIQARLGMKSGLWIDVKAADSKGILEKLIFEQINQFTIPFRNVYGFNGRDPDDPLRYICPDGSELTRLERLSSTELKNAPGILWDLLLNVNCVMPNGIGIIALILRALASVLNSPALEGKSKPSLGLVLLGSTGVQKTSAIEALYGMHGIGNRSTCRSNFKSTASAVQSLFAKVRDDVVVIDDIFPPQLHSERRQEREIFSFVIRAVGDEGGARQKCQGKDVTSHSVSSLFVFTAETLPDCSRSDIYRTVILPLSEVHTEALSWLQGHQDVIQYYSRLFVRYVSLSNSKVTQLYNNFLQARKNLQFEPIPKRLISNWAWLEAGRELLYEFCRDVLLSQAPGPCDKFDEIFKKCSDDLEKVISEEASQYGEQSILPRVFSILREMYEEDHSIFGKYQKHGHKYVSTTPLNHAIGFFSRTDTSYVYFRAESCLNAIKKFSKQRGYRFDDVVGLTARRFRELLGEAGLIATEVHTSSHLTTRLQVNGQTVYVTCLNREKFEHEFTKIN